MARSKRYGVLDALRGFALLNMIVYHVLWNLEYIFDCPLPWLSLGSHAASVWQLAIRVVFIMLSGFCWSLGSHHWRRGLTVLGCSVIISVVTAVFTPDSLIQFGVLSLIGTGMILMMLVDRCCKKLPAFLGLLVCLLLFVMTLSVGDGVLGVGRWAVALPEWLYANLFTAYLGFPPRGFFSTDYVPLLPWIFLYAAGYFLYRIFKKASLLSLLSVVHIAPLEWLGRHSLILYMLHQPLIYTVMYAVFTYLI